jgi:hypothetical protein
VSIALDDPPLEPDPTWTRIDTLTGCRVRDWTVDRGRPTEFDKTGPGTAVVHIVDLAGLFDPTNPSSPYNDKILPGKQAAVALQNPTNSNWYLVFRGFIESWQYKLDITRQFMELELQLVDGFAMLARAELRVGIDGTLPPFAEFTDPDKRAALATLAAGNVLYGETEGTGADRVQAILGDVGWPDELRESGTDVFSLNTQFGPKAYGPGTSALDALFDAVDGEFPGVSNAWMSKTGHVTVHGRLARFRPDVAEYGIGRYNVADPSGWADGIVPLAELEWSNGQDNLYNAASATPQGVGQGAEWRMLDPAKDDVAGQYVKDDTSIAAYGLRSITFDQLQTIHGLYTHNDSMAETRLFAQYYVDNYKDPAPRISRMVFKSRRPGETHANALWGFLCQAEISDLLTLFTGHPGGGGFTDYVGPGTGTDFYIEGLHYTCSPGGVVPIVELSLDVSPRANFLNDPFVIDPDPGP